MRMNGQVFGIFLLTIYFNAEAYVPFDKSDDVDQDGSEAKMHKLFSYYVDVKSVPKDTLISFGEIFYCGGAVISSRWIITHPRCCQKGYSYRVFANTTEHCQGNEIGVYECEVHSNRSIALIKTNPIRFTKDIKSIQLPTRSSPFFDTGSGNTFMAGRGHDTAEIFDFGLKEVDIDLSYYTKCSVLNLESIYCGAIEDETLNVAYPGSPLVLKTDKGLVLIGIYQGNVVDNVGKFAKLGKFIDWIEEKTFLSLN